MTTVESGDTPVRVEPATVDDADTVADLWVELAASQRPHGAHLLAEPNRSAAREFLGQLIVAGDVYVARVGGRVVGFVSVHVETGAYDQDATRGVVDNVYVRPEFRGRGVGLRLLDAAETALVEDGASVLAISALADNDGARRLYESRGYSPHRVTFERSVSEEGTDGPGGSADSSGGGADGSDTHSREADR